MFAVNHIQEWKQPRYEVIEEMAFTYPQETVVILLRDNKKDMYNLYVTDHFDEYIIFEDSLRQKIWVFIKTHEPEPFEIACENYPWLTKDRYGF